MEGIEMVGFILSIIMCCYAAYINYSWSKYCEEMNNRWAEHYNEINDKWADFCGRIIKKNEGE